MSHLRERNSTRGTPGGSSSLGYLFGGDAPPAPAAKPSSNAFASGASQNSGNVITDRPTTRVHHAPGGSSSLSFGWGAEEEKKPARAAPAAPAAAVADAYRAPPAPSAASAAAAVAPAAPAVGAPRVSSNAYASGASQNTGNVITDRPTTRVHHAPGGASSFSLGWGGAEEEKKPARPAPAAAAAASPFAGDRDDRYGRAVAPPAAAAPAAAEPAAAAAAAAPAASSRVSSNAYASGANQNCGNVITDRPTTRVMHAPGGKSSVNIFSWTD